MSPCHLVSRVNGVAAYVVLLLFACRPGRILGADPEFNIVYTDPSTPLAGDPFDLIVLGKEFDIESDRMMLIPTGQSCGSTLPPPGNPGSVQEFASFKCNHHGSAQTKMICHGLVLHTRGSFAACYCDASRPLPGAAPGDPDPGCATVDRFSTGGSSKGAFDADGPDVISELIRKAGVRTTLRISGSGFTSGDRVRIVGDNISCADAFHSKSFHPSVGSPQPDAAPVPALSTAYELVWNNVYVGLPGRYHVCWCGTSMGRACNSDAEFNVRMATMNVVGPSVQPLQNCTTGVPCLMKYTGSGLADTDRITIISKSRKCGGPGAARMNFAVNRGADGQRTSGDLETSRWGGLVLSTKSQYQICYCGAYHPNSCPYCCSEDQEFNVFVGMINVDGPTQGQLIRPILGETFSYTVNGNFLSNKDRISIIGLEAKCGQPGAEKMSDGVWPMQAPIGPPAESNATSNTWHNIKLTKGDTYHVCWCGHYTGECKEGKHYSVDVGLISPRGPDMGPNDILAIHAVVGMPFALQVKSSTLPEYGHPLSTRDRVRIVDPEAIRGICGESGTLQHSKAVAPTVCSPACAKSPISGEPVMSQPSTGSEEYQKITRFETWDPVLLSKDGTYMICWCPNMENDCLDDDDFVINLGTITASGVRADQTWRCSSNDPCEIEVGSDSGLGSGDAIQLVPMGGDNVCGTSRRADGSSFSRGTRVFAGSFKGEVAAKFDLGLPRAPGIFQVCYCQRFNDCMSDADFFQRSGVLTVAGLISGNSRQICYLNSECLVMIQGSMMGSTDAVMLFEKGKNCGDHTGDGSGYSTRFSGADPSKVFDSDDGEKFFLLDHNSGQMDGGLQEFKYDLGIPEVIGSYKLCFCDQKRTKKGTCRFKEDFNQDAGDLYVRGLEYAVKRICTQGEDCDILLTAYEVHPEDKIVLIDVNGTCGHDEALIDPLEADSVQKEGRESSLSIATFVLQETLTPGKFKICYCSHMKFATSCVKPDGSANIHRFGHLGGTLRIEGVIQEVKPMPGIEEGADPLPASPHAVSVNVDVMMAGARLICVAAPARAAVNEIPQRGDFENCTNEATSRFPRCWGTTTTDPIGDVGTETVHIVLNPHDESLVTSTSHIHVWCYPSEFCSAGRCIMPATREGLKIPLFQGLKTYRGHWETGAAIPFNLGISTAPGFNVGQSWTRIKFVPAGEDCNIGVMPKAIEGLACHGGGKGKCEPPPQSVFSNSYADHRQLIWENLKVDSAGSYSVCYCDRHYYQTCMQWLAAGTLDVSGPKTRSKKYTGNPSKTIAIRIQGQGLSSADRLILKPSNLECDVFFGSTQPNGTEGTPITLTSARVTTTSVGPGSTSTVATSTMSPGTTTSISGTSTTDGSNSTTVISINASTTTNMVSSTLSTTSIPDSKSISPAGNGTSNSSGSASRRLNIVWLGNEPNYVHVNGSEEEWLARVDDVGKYHACWCSGGDGNLCQYERDFKVKVGTVEVVEAKDCILTDWWVIGSCDKECGGGKIQMKRSIKQKPSGGGVPCPSEQELYAVKACKTQPCPLARLDNVETLPSEVRAGSPFTVKIKGHWFSPPEDRILLVDGDVPCGEAGYQHYGGASCDQIGSSKQQLVCGDGKLSIIVQQPGKYRLCACDATAALVRNPDGSGNMSSGNSDALGLFSQGCESLINYNLEPIQGSVFEVLPKLLSESTDDEGDTINIFDFDVPMGAFIGAIVGMSVLACCIAAKQLGLWASCLKPVVGQEGLQKFKMSDPSSKGMVPSEQDIAAGGSDPAMVQWWDQYYQQLGYAPGTGYQVFGLAPQAGEAAPLTQHLALPAPSPPPPDVPAIPAQPPPTPPPQRALAIKDGNTSFSDLVRRAATPDGAPPPPAGGAPWVAGSRPGTGARLPTPGEASNGSGGFLGMSLTPLPSPTATPRTPGATPRGGADPSALQNGLLALPAPQEHGDTSGSSDGEQSARSKRSAPSLPRVPAAPSKTPPPAEPDDDDLCSLALTESESNGGATRRSAASTVRGEKPSMASAFGTKLTQAALNSHNKLMKGSKVTPEDDVEGQVAAGVDQTTPRSARTDNSRTPRALKTFIGGKLAKALSRNSSRAPSIRGGESPEGSKPASRAPSVEPHARKGDTISIPSTATGGSPPATGGPPPEPSLPLPPDMRPSTPSMAPPPLPPDADSPKAKSSDGMRPSTPSMAPPPLPPDADSPQAKPSDGMRPSIPSMAPPPLPPDAPEAPQPKPPEPSELANAKEMTNAERAPKPPEMTKPPEISTKPLEIPSKPKDLPKPLDLDASSSIMGVSMPPVPDDAPPSPSVMSASNASGMSVTVEDVGKKLPPVLPRPPEPPSGESTMESGQKIPEIPRPPEPPSVESTQEIKKMPEVPPQPPEPPSLESTQDFTAGAKPSTPSLGGLARKMSLGSEGSTGGGPPPPPPPPGATLPEPPSPANMVPSVSPSPSGAVRSVSPGPDLRPPVSPSGSFRSTTPRSARLPPPPPPPNPQQKEEQMEDPFNQTQNSSMSQSSSGPMAMPALPTESPVVSARSSRPGPSLDVALINSDNESEGSERRSPNGSPVRFTLGGLARSGSSAVTQLKSPLASSKSPAKSSAKKPKTFVPPTKEVFAKPASAAPPPIFSNTSLPPKLPQGIQSASPKAKHDGPSSAWN